MSPTSTGRLSARVHTTERGEPLSAELVTLRWGSLLVKIAEAPAVGDPVTVELDLPGGETRQFSGDVVHVMPPVRPGELSSVGISLDVDSESEAELDALGAKLQVPAAEPEPEPEPEPAEPVEVEVEVEEPRGADVGGARASRTSVCQSNAIVGIDFGTSACRVAVVGPGGLRLLPDEAGRVSIPSLVWLRGEGDYVVGHEAERQTVIDPSATIPSIKRLLGRRIDDEGAVPVLMSLTVPGRAGPNRSIEFEMHGEVLNPARISAIILGHMKEIAERHLGSPIDKVVLAYPMAFGDRQRAELGRAARLAGLEVAAFIPEGTAAAMAHGLDTTLGSVGVYDLGAGAFDFCVLTPIGKVMQVVAAAGDPRLGGDDLTRSLADSVAGQVLEATGEDLRRRGAEWQRVLLACEVLKRRLSEVSSVEVRMPGLGGPGGTTVRVKRQQLETMAEGLVDKTLAICERALDRAGPAAGVLARVLLTGGTTRMPVVQSGVRRLFGRDVDLAADPELAVVVGAAIQGARVAGRPSSEVHAALEDFGEIGARLRKAQPSPRPPEPGAGRELSSAGPTGDDLARAASADLVRTTAALSGVLDSAMSKARQEAEKRRTMPARPAGKGDDDVESVVIPMGPRTSSLRAEAQPPLAEALEALDAGEGPEDMRPAEEVEDTVDAKPLGRVDRDRRARARDPEEAEGSDSSVGSLVGAVEAERPSREDEKTTRWLSNPWVSARRRARHPSALTLPCNLGRYELLAPIGIGGMATIYLARIPGPAGFQKPVAIKVIHSHLGSDPEFVDMFMNEATIASQLQHPNIVQIFELGEDGGVFFISMEILWGETVPTVTRRLVSSTTGLTDPRIACHICGQAAEGLHYAHELSDLSGRPMKLVHRDVSPQNLLVTYSGGVKLLDFGVAKAAGTSQSTASGAVKGKFSYMAPEQVWGQGVDRRADVFSLGVTFWEMLSGERLFKGESHADTVRLVSQAEVPRISSLRDDVPESLDKVVLRSLARDPTERYQTAQELVEDLSLVQSLLGSPVSTNDLAVRMERGFSGIRRTKQDYVSQLLRVPSEDLVTMASEEEDSTPSGSSAPSNAPTPLASAPAGPTTGQGGGGGEVDARRRWRGPWGTLLIVIVAALGGALGSWLLMTRSGGDALPSLLAPALPAPDDAGGHDVSPAPESSLDGDTADAPVVGLEVAPDQVELRLDVFPTRARIQVDGVQHPDGGPILLPRSAEPVRVDVTAPGFATETLRLTPDRDHHRTVELRPEVVQ